MAVYEKSVIDASEEFCGSFSSLSGLGVPSEMDIGALHFLLIVFCILPCITLRPSFLQFTFEVEVMIKNNDKKNLNAEDMQNMPPYVNYFFEKHNTILH